MQQRLIARLALRGLAAVLGVALLALLAWWLLPNPTVPLPGGGHVPPGATGDAFFSDLFKVYTPRRVCMFYEAPLIWLHLLSDLLIGIAYFSIPVALVYFARKRRDVRFGWILWMFALFIISCGATHFIGAWDLWQPLYRLDGLVKAFTAAVSIATAIALWPLIPAALALPSPAELERRVEERTRELGETNAALMAEIAARQKAETERERLLESEREARAEAERANRVKDQFLATLSHELRTPLNAILGWSQLLERDGVDPGRRAEGVAVIRRNAQAQARLIDDLLDVSRIESGKLRLEIDRVDLADVIDAAIASVQHAAEARGIRIERRIDAAVTMGGDPHRLQQVVWNLLSNALKFTPPGGSVEVALRRSDVAVELVVSDTGEGIPPAFLPHVFERFRQADQSISRQHAGLGLGLAIVHHLVELHGGTIAVENRSPEPGARFTIRLPITPIPEGAETVAGTVEPAADALHGLRTVVVDDRRDAREMLSAALHSYGAEVSTAGSADDALRLIEALHPDLLLCDLGMPDVDGFELVARLRRHPDPAVAGLPAIAVSALTSTEARRQAQQAGFDAFQPKPVVIARLVAAAARLVVQPR